MLIGFGVLAVLFWFLPFVRPWFAGEASVADAFQWAGGWRQTTSFVFLALGVGLFTLSGLSHAATRPIYITWMSVTVPIGIVMSTLMLSLMFFIVLPIFSLIVRRSDPMRRAFRAPGSYWETHKQREATLERMKRLF
ncbi:MAG: hypothetical protein ACPGXK_07300 [Phycisphaerae bacterium]